MWQLLAAIVAIGLFVFAVKVAIVLLFLAGLIFRTKETVGLIAILATFAGFAAQPLIASGVVAALVALSLYFKRKEQRRSDDPDQST